MFSQIQYAILRIVAVRTSIASLLTQFYISAQQSQLCQSTRFLITCILLIIQIGGLLFITFVPILTLLTQSYIIVFPLLKRAACRSFRWSRNSLISFLLNCSRQMLSVSLCRRVLTIDPFIPILIRYMSRLTIKGMFLKRSLLQSFLKRVKQFIVSGVSSLDELWP